MCALFVMTIAISSCHGEIDQISSIAAARNWLAKDSYEHRLLLMNGMAPENPRILDEDKWISEGRQIEGVSNALRTLLRNHDPNVELPQLIRAIGLLKDSKSVPLLLQFIDDDDFHIRFEVVRAFSRIRDRRSVVTLGERLTKEKDENIRCNIATALANIGGPEANKLLISLANDESKLVREVLIRELLELLNRNKH